MSTTAIASVMTDVTIVNIETTTGFGKYHFCIGYHASVNNTSRYI